MPDAIRQKKQKDALEAYHYWKSGKSSLRQAAAKYNVDKNMVVRAPNLGKKQHSRRFFKNKEEDEIEKTITHIVSVERYGLSRLICETANQVLRSKEIKRRKEVDKRNDANPQLQQGLDLSPNISDSAEKDPKSYSNPNKNTLNPDLSRGWAKRFIERHPHVGRGVILSSKESKDKTFTFPIVQAWFSIYLASMQYFNISPSNLYSIGEVSLGDIFQDSSYKCDSTRGETPAVLETVSGDGTILPSYFILGDKKKSPSTDLKNMDNVSFSSQSTSAGTQFKNHSVDFLINHFDALTAEKSDNRRITRGIIIDGTSKFASSFTGASDISIPYSNNGTMEPSNTNLEFFIEAAKRNIVAFILPVLPGDTHLKPFDQSRFTSVIKNEVSLLSVKSDYSAVKNEPKSSPSFPVDIDNPTPPKEFIPRDMINIYSTAKSKVNSSDVTVGFSKSGLIPFSPCEVNGLFYYKDSESTDIINKEFLDNSVTKSEGKEDVDKLQQLSKLATTKRRKSNSFNSKAQKPSFYLNSVNLLNSDQELDDDDDGNGDDDEDDEMIDIFDKNNMNKAQLFKLPVDLEKRKAFYKIPSSKVGSANGSSSSSSSGYTTGDSESITDVSSPGSMTSLSTFSSASSTPADIPYIKAKGLKSDKPSFSSIYPKNIFIPTTFPPFPLVPYPTASISVSLLSSPPANSSESEPKTKSFKNFSVNNDIKVLRPESIAPFTFESAVKKLGATPESFAQIYEQYARIKWTCTEYQDRFNSKRHC